MTVIRAEIEQTKRVEIEVDVEKHCAHYSMLRADFGGTDEEFVLQGIDEMAYDVLSDPPYTSILDDGVRAVDGYDGEVEVNIIGVMAS